MKKIFFVLAILTMSLFPVCKANNPDVSAKETAKQFGYYVAFGDAVKADLIAVYTSDHRNFMVEYITPIKADILENGGLDKISVIGEEVITANVKTNVTIAYECKLGEVIKQTYTLIMVDGAWKIDMGLL